MPAIYKNGNIYGGGGSGGGTAATTTFDDTNVEFSANNVQDAFEEVTKTLTQQEYDALSTAEKNNGTIYFISDGTATNVVECTQATYPATPKQDTFYLISDAPSLQGTSADLLYESGSATTTKAKIDSKADQSTTYTKTEVDIALSGVMPTSGSNANGNWIKFPDGTMICYKKVSVNLPIGSWQTWGSCYETKDAISMGNWPQAFIETPTETVTSAGGAAWLEYLINYSATSAGATRMVRPSDPGTTYSTNLNVIGIGRWKA